MRCVLIQCSLLCPFFEPLVIRMRFVLVSLVVGFLLSACSVEDIPLLYKHEIQQGNIVTQEQLNKLEKGMTKNQVKFILGSPAVVDNFHPNRWNYVYTLRPSSGEKKRTRTTLIFEDDRLAATEGDLVPAW